MYTYMDTYKSEIVFPHNFTVCLGHSKLYFNILVLDSSKNNVYQYVATNMSQSDSPLIGKVRFRIEY